MMCARPWDDKLYIETNTKNKERYAKGGGIVNAKLYKQVYRMQTEDGRKWADIEFVDGKFSHCKYVVSRVTSYTLDDWKFLKQVASEIERLALSYEVEKGGLR